MSGSDQKEHKSRNKRDKDRWKSQHELKVRRNEHKVLVRLKVAPPSEYDGRVDLTVFDKWTYEVDTWA